MSPRRREDGIGEMPCASKCRINQASQGFSRHQKRPCVLANPQRKSLSSETKIRDKQLLDSLFSGTNKAENVALNEKTEESKEPKTRPSILKPSKSTVKIATATLNENVKKQSYRIKFKVKLNENNSKKQTSVLRYLFGCFGGEKLFNSQHK